MLKDLTYKGFRASDNQQLISIRQLEYAKEKARVQADANMSEADRGKCVAELDDKLAALQKQAAQ